MICCIFSGDMYLFLGTFTSASTSLLASSFLAVLFVETLVISSAILLPMKSTVASAVFWIALFDAVFIATVVDFFSLSICFWPYLLLRF